MDMYHYTECGLSNVWLRNGFSIKNYGGQQAVAISDADQLHQVIGRALANKPYLRATELRFLRKELGLSQARLAALLGSTEQTVSLWERKGRIPKGHDRLIRLLYIEKIDGNVKIQQMIDRLIDMDRKDAEKLVFSDTRAGWKMAA